jgi:hypothetical protein
MTRGLTSVPDPDAWRDEIRKEAMRIHESAMLSSETQFEYAKRWRRVDRWIGGLASALAGVAGVGGLADVLTVRWAGFIAICSAVAGAVAVSLGAPKTKEKASISANAYRTLQQNARVFLNIDLPHLDKEEARERLQTLVDSLQALNRDADIPSSGAFGRAKKAISAGAQSYEADE